MAFSQLIFVSGERKISNFAIAPPYYYLHLYVFLARFCIVPLCLDFDAAAADADLLTYHGLTFLHDHSPFRGHMWHHLLRRWIGLP